MNSYLALPPVTKCYFSASVITTIASTLGLVSHYAFYLDWNLILHRNQFWRLATNFTYFDELNLNFIFHMFNIVHFCKALENQLYHGRELEMVWMMIVGAIAMLFCSYLLPVTYLSYSMSLYLMYIWSRNNPGRWINFSNLFRFRAPYWPWIAIGIGFVLEANPMKALPVRMLGIICGHIYYYLEFVLPQFPGYFKDKHVLSPPRIL